MTGMHPARTHPVQKRELDDMSDGTGHPETFDLLVPSSLYNDGPIPVHTRYLNSRKLQGVPPVKG
jgi:hypothetical protein